MGVAFVTAGTGVAQTQLTAASPRRTLEIRVEVDTHIGGAVSESEALFVFIRTIQQPILVQFFSSDDGGTTFNPLSLGLERLWASQARQWVVAAHGTDMRVEITRDPDFGDTFIHARAVLR